MIRKKITTRKVHEITGLAPSTIRAGKAGTHVLTRVKHGRTYRYILDEASRSCGRQVEINKGWQVAPETKEVRGGNDGVGRDQALKHQVTLVN